MQMSHLLLNLRILLLLHQILLISLGMGILGTISVVSGSCQGFEECVCSISSSLTAVGQAQEEPDLLYPSVRCEKASFSSIPVIFDPQLKSLHISFSALSSLSLLAGLYPSLIILDVSHNHISSLDFSHYPRLRRINLSWNAVGELSGHIFQALPLLTHLNLAHNSLSYIHPKAFLHVPHLVSLDLSYNFISDLHFFNESLMDGNETLPFQSLETLSLAANRLNETAFCSLMALPSVTVLDISQASTVNLSCLLDHRHLPKLRHLSAASCSLKQFDPDFFARVTDKGSRLTMLNLTGNEIEQLGDISDIWLLRLSQHQQLTIDLVGNPIICDCSFYRLYLGLADQFEERLQGISCLKRSSRTHDLAVLQSQCFPTPSFLFPLVISLLLFALVLGGSVVLIVYCRKKKREKALFPSLRWQTGCKSIQYEDETRDQVNICRSDSTGSSHLSPEMDVKLHLDVVDSEEELENIYATIDELYVNRDYIEAAQKLPITAKLQPVTEL